MTEEKKPMTLVAYVFAETDVADAALKDLKEVRQTHSLTLADAAVLVKEEGGKIHIKETDDLSGKTGATWGAVVGGLVGLIGGPLGAVAGGAMGAAIGGAWAHFRDSGINDDELKQMAETLGAGESALLVLVSEAEATAMSQAMSGTASGKLGKLVTLNTSQDVATMTETFKRAVDSLTATAETPPATDQAQSSGAAVVDIPQPEGHGEVL